MKKIFTLTTIFLSLLCTQTSYATTKYEASAAFFEEIRTDVEVTENDINSACLAGYRFTNPQHSNSSMNCNSVSGTFVLNNLTKFTFDNGKITNESFVADNISFSAFIIRDPYPRAGSVSITDGKNSITIDTGNGNPRNYIFTDCYLPIMNETALLNDVNGKGLGLTSSQLTGELNRIWQDIPENNNIHMVFSAKRILTSSTEREFYINAIREKQKKEEVKVVVNPKKADDTLKKSKKKKKVKTTE